VKTYLVKPFFVSNKNLRHHRPYLAKKMSKYGASSMLHFDSDDGESCTSYGSDISVVYDDRSFKRMKTFSLISQDDDIKRKPTRRPDPKVTNRNALMARENRRKQKERTEKLELENSMLMKKNSELNRLLKDKDNTISRMKKEYNYLKSVIANKTSILAVLNSLKSSQLPISSSLETFSTRREKSPATESTISASSGYESPNLNEASAHDYEMDTNALATGLWNDLGDTNLLSDTKPPVYDLTDTELLLGDDVANEHSYSEIKDPGVCVHISNQRVSIEFCESCHSNAADGWLEH